MRQFHWLVGTAACISLWLVTGCGGQQQQSLKTDANGPYADAVKLFEQNCISCHGNNMEGGVGPNLQHVGARLSKSQIQERIQAGGGAMPGFGPSHQNILTEAQIQSLVDWLSTKK